MGGYFQAKYDLIDFYERDIKPDELEFSILNRQCSFPVLEKANGYRLLCGEKSEWGPFYRVIRAGDVLLFADEPIEPQVTALPHMIIGVCILL